MNYMKEIHSVLKEKGLIELIHYSYGHIKRKMLSYSDFIFDIKYRVNTCGQKSRIDLYAGDSMMSSYISYEPTPVKVMRSIFNNIKPNYNETTFVDFGSGKGRILLLASEYNYKKIIGVELSSQLHKIAEENIRKWKSIKKGCGDIVSINVNAIEFKLPDEPLVLFFFTPFLGSVFAEIVIKINDYLNRTKHPITIIYYGSNKDIIKMLSDLKLYHEIIYSKNIMAETGKYERHLFARSV